MLHHAAFRGQIAMAVWLLQLNPSLLRQKSVDEVRLRCDWQNFN